jgi:hypothetical protein
VAGAGHLSVHVGIELIPGGVLGPDPILLEDLCLNQINSTADGPVFFSYVMNALWESMEQQVRLGRAPPAGVQMEVDEATGVVQRDEFGNGLGGVRLPSMEVPTATYTPGNVADPTLPGLLVFIGNLACRLSSSATPFDQETIDELYPNHGTYVSQVAKAANDLAAQGLLLAKDRKKIVIAAAHSSIACGLGFEVGLLLPALMWLNQRRRRSR